MSDSTWELSLREAGEASDTTVVVTGLTEDVFGAIPASEPTATLTFGPLAGEADRRQRFETARQLLDYAHTGARGTDANGVPWYRERLPDVAPVDSQAILLSPSADVAQLSFEGVWAIVIGGAQERIDFAPRLELELFVLADESDYADRGAVQTALGEQL